MRILVTNDDGIFADGLWKLVRELKKIGPVVVVAPDREQSAVGTAVTLRQPLRVRKLNGMLPGVETYSVEGTPSDSVILALSKLAKNGIDLVVSGINSGPNLGDDVFISGTVGAALQGHFHGLPALAISIDAAADSPHLEGAAKIAALLAKRIDEGSLPRDVFLNVNVPGLPLEEIKGVSVTRLANQTHGNTVAARERHNGRQPYYWLVRRRLPQETDTKTDIGAIEQGNISITPLQTNLLSRPSTAITHSLCSDLLRELREEKNS